MEKVGIFGGSFNPPHVGHVLAATYVLCTSDLDRLVVIPTFQHPFAKLLAPYEERVTMTELAMGWLPRVEISRIEESLGGESRTVRTLEALQSMHPEWSMRLVMGSDIMREASKWFAFERIRELAPPLVLDRVGYSGSASATALLPDVSSTMVRDKIASGCWDELAALLPNSVLSYVRAHNLYGAGE